MDAGDIRLVPMTDEMYHRYFREYAHDPDLLLPGQPSVSYVYSKERVERYIRRQKERQRIPLAIMRQDEIVGEVILKDVVEHTCATLSIVLKRPEYKDHGIGTVAEGLAIRYVFNELDIPTLYADTIRSNTRSQHVLEKAGFAFVCEDDEYRYYRADRDGDLRGRERMCSDGSCTF